MNLLSGLGSSGSNIIIFLNIIEGLAAAQSSLFSGLGSLRRLIRLSPVGINRKILAIELVNVLLFLNFLQLMLDSGVFKSNFKRDACE